MKKFLILFIILLSSVCINSSPFQIVSQEDELKVYNNLSKIIYTFEGEEDYVYTDKTGIASDTWVVFFHSFTGNARELYRSHIYKDLWISTIRGSEYGSVSMNIFGDSFMAGNTPRACHYMIHYLKDRYNVKRFVFAGASMGGFCALRYAQLYPEDVFCVIAISPNTYMKSMFCDRLQNLFGDALAKSRDKFFPTDESVKECNINDKAYKLTMPVFLAYSREDEMISAYETDEFVKRLNWNYKFKYIRYNAGTHFQTFSKGFADGWDWFLQYISK